MLNYFQNECTKKYMLRFKDWATKGLEADEIIVHMKRIIAHEKNDRQNLAGKYRRKIHRMIQEEKRLISE